MRILALFILSLFLFSCFESPNSGEANESHGTESSAPSSEAFEEDHDNDGIPDIEDANPEGFDVDADEAIPEMYDDQPPPEMTTSNSTRAEAPRATSYTRSRLVGNTDTGTINISATDVQDSRSSEGSDH